MQARPRALSITMATTLALLLAGAGARPATATEPYLVKDIEPVPTPNSSYPVGFVSLGATALFGASNGQSPRQVWSTDGTEAGTHALDACDGPCTIGFANFLPAGARAFFWPLDATGHRELWLTEGTDSRTQRVVSGLTPAGEWVWAPSAGKAFFVATDTTFRKALWVTDGTEAGTRPVTEPRQSSDSVASGLTPFRGGCAFVARTATGKVEVWFSDGTPAGTRRVAGPWALTDSYPVWLAATPKRLFFQASTPRSGVELWSSDGTAKGTLVLDLVRGTSWAPVGDRVAIGDSLYFALARNGRQELWSTAGTAKTTRQRSSADFKALYLSKAVPVGGRWVFPIADATSTVALWALNPKAGELSPLCGAAGCGLSPTPIGSVGDRVVFSVNGDNGLALWLTDGTAAGTRQLLDFCASGNDNGTCPYSVFALGGTPAMLTLLARTIQGYDLWAVRPAGAGSLTVTELQPIRSDTSTGLVEGTVAGGTVVFAARDDAAGQEPWRTDGTTAGTHLLRDIATADLGGSRPEDFVATGGELTFTASVNGERAFFRSDGTAAGTRQVGAIEPWMALTAPVTVGNALLVLARNPDTDVAIYGQLWRLDGTAADDVPLAAAGHLPSIGSNGLRALFTGYDGMHDGEPWITDGTVAGTHLVADVNPGIGSSTPMAITAAGSRFFFTAETDELGRELWVTDGTGGGTRLVADLAPGEESSELGPCAAVGNDMFFIRHPQYGRSELWRTDGTLAGTVNLGGFDAPYFPVQQPIAVLGQGAIVFAHDAIWASDGVHPGLQKLGTATAWDLRPTVFGGRVYFGALVSSYLRLWRTDGTVAGTGPVLDGAGGEIFGPGDLALFHDRLYFVAPSAGNPALWSSDGTTAGTTALGTIGLAQVSGGTDPWPILAAGNRLFFRGWDAVHGWELWAVP